MLYVREGLVPALDRTMSVVQAVAARRDQVGLVVQVPTMAVVRMAVVAAVLEILAAMERLGQTLADQVVAWAAQRAMELLVERRRRLVRVVLEEAARKGLVLVRVVWALIVRGMHRTGREEVVAVVEQPFRPTSAVLVDCMAALEAVLDGKAACLLWAVTVLKES